MTCTAHHYGPCKAVVYAKGNMKFTKDTYHRLIKRMSEDQANSRSWSKGGNKCILGCLEQPDGAESGRGLVRLRVTLLTLSVAENEA